MKQLARQAMPGPFPQGLPEDELRFTGRWTSLMPKSLAVGLLKFKPNPESLYPLLQAHFVQHLIRAG